MHNSRGTILVSVISVFIPFAIIMTGLRLWSRRLKHTKWTLSDFFLMLGLITCIGTVIVAYLLVLKGGAGLPINELTDQQFHHFYIIFVAAPLLWVVASCSVKLSYLKFYLEIFPGRPIRYMVLVLCILTFLLFVVVLVESFTLCRPFGTSSGSLGRVTCRNVGAAYLGVSVVNLVMDFAIMVLPLPFLWRVQMPTKDKIATSAIFAVGLVITGMSLWRCVAVTRITADYTSTVIYNLIAGNLEIELGIINACVPFMRPVMSKVFGKHSSLRQTLSRSSQRFSALSSRSGLTLQSSGGSGRHAHGMTAAEAQAVAEDKRMHRLYGDAFLLSSPSSRELAPSPSEGRAADQPPDVEDGHGVYSDRSSSSFTITIDHPPAAYKAGGDVD